MSFTPFCRLQYPTLTGLNGTRDSVFTFLLFFGYELSFGRKKLSRFTNLRLFIARQIHVA